jgi:hypothetical protein
MCFPLHPISAVETGDYYMRVLNNKLIKLKRTRRQDAVIESWNM